MIASSLLNNSPTRSSGHLACNWHRSSSSTNQVGIVSSRSRGNNHLRVTVKSRSGMRTGRNEYDAWMGTPSPSPTPRPPTSTTLALTYGHQILFNANQLYYPWNAC